MDVILACEISPASKAFKPLTLNLSVVLAFLWSVQLTSLFPQLRMQSYFSGNSARRRQADQIIARKTVKEINLFFCPLYHDSNLYWCLWERQRNKWWWLDCKVDVSLQSSVWLVVVLTKRFSVCKHPSCPPTERLKSCNSIYSPRSTV